MVAWPGALFASAMFGDGGGGEIRREIDTGWIEVDGAWLRAQVRHAVAAYFAPLAWGLAWLRPVGPP